MKKLFCISLLFIGLVSLSRAAEVGLIYENEAAVKEGRTTLGTVTLDGILTTAKFALANNSTLMVGLPGDKLRKANLLRLDSKSDLALLQLGDEVAKPELQKLFQEKAAAISAFLPSSSSGTAAGLVAGAPQYVSTDPFYLKINDVIVGSDPIELPVKRGEAQFHLEVVRPSTVPVWNIEIVLTAEPKLTFWKKNKQRTLNEVPKATFIYSHQSMFLPYANGRSEDVWVDVYSIKEESYDFLFKINSKAGNYEKKVRVQFKPNK